MRASGRIIAGLLVLPVLLAFGYLYSQRTPVKPRFYVDDDLDWDVWEIPIIEPHRLITTFSELPPGSDTRWSFSEENLANHFSPDSVNYQKGFITFSAPYKKQYGFYDLKHDKTTFLTSYQQFVDFTSSQKIEKTLYNAESVYKCWQQTRQLPWAKEIFVQNYGPTTSN